MNYSLLSQSIKILFTIANCSAFHVPSNAVFSCVISVEPQGKYILASFLPHCLPLFFLFFFLSLPLPPSLFPSLPRARSLRPVRSAPCPVRLSLSCQAETPLSRTCQDASPVARDHRPPRRGAGAAVRLHDRQRECPARGARAGGRGGPGAHPELGLRTAIPAALPRICCRLQTASLRHPRAFCSCWQSAPFQLF